jgi:proline dehydrogenase
MLWLASNDRAERLVRRSRLTRPLVRRFIAGDTLDEALAHARRLNESGMDVSLDLLGENVRDESAAGAACDAYVDTLKRIDSSGVRANISIKLTMLGLDISDDTTWMNLERIVSHADALGNFVRIDMEGSDYTDRTLSLFRRIHDLYPLAVGIVLQSYLYRTDRDVEEMIERKARVRIVKGAYNEPVTVAYPHKSDVDDAFRRHIERLIEAGSFPAVATHDDAMLSAARAHAVRAGISREDYEFQMIFGVRRDLQEALARLDYRMRVYVPFGESWYPYFMRRLAERPANLFFIIRQVFSR